MSLQVGLPAAGIFYPLENASFFHFHLSCLQRVHTGQLEHYHDLDQFVRSDHRIKIALLDINCYPMDAVENLVAVLQDVSDAVLIVSSELHPHTLRYMRRYDQHNITYFVPGWPDTGLTNSASYLYLDWFTTTCKFYKSVRPDMLDLLRPHDVKPYCFDALLGRPKAHRQMAYDFISDRLKEHCVMTYMIKDGIPLSQRPEHEWIWETEQSHQIWTCDKISYHDHVMSLSQVIPISVYNKTAYTVIAETYCGNDFVFLTEKTVKPILAKRLFVMLGDRHSLYRLRELGFRTFHGIIDESYDAVIDPQQRVTMALIEIEKLCQRDQQPVLDLVAPIAEHNFHHLMSMDWYDVYFRQPFENTLEQALDP